MINLELPKSMQDIAELAHGVGEGMFRPISRKYDRAEHDYPKEIDALRDLMGNTGDATSSSGDDKDKQKKTDKPADGSKNGVNMTTVVGMIEMCWGDVGLTLSIPGRGLGNAAIQAVGSPEQKKKFGGKWAAMAITEPAAGSDSGAIKTTARRDGDDWVINGEKIYVTAGDRCEAVVVWANIDPEAGKAGIKSFVVEKGTPGMELVRLEKKLGIRSSDTAAFSFNDCRIPGENLLGSAEILDKKKGFGGVMQTFDNTRPMVAAMAIGVGKAALEVANKLLSGEGVRTEAWDLPPARRTAVEDELIRLEAEWEAARLLTLKAAWMADNGKRNSLEAAMCKAKAGRMGNEVTLRCVELCGVLGYSENELLEKWARDSKILDIFEGTQQIQQLIIARQLLGKSSRELK